MRKTALLRDEHGLVGFSLMRWIIVIVVLGVLMIEGGSIIFTAIGLQNAADGAAVEAARVWKESQNLEAASAAVLEELDDREQDEARLVSIDADSTEPFEVRIEVKKRAATLIVHRIGFLKGLATVDVEAEGRVVAEDV